MKQAQRILIMGLPGSGKTYLAQHLLEHLQNDKKRVAWLNADDVPNDFFVDCFCATSNWKWVSQ